MLNNHNNITNKSRSSFTLIELLVVLALVAILSVVVVMTLNPAELLKQARDSNRLSDLATINTALNLFSTDVTSGFMGTSTIVYVSLPDNSSSACGSWGLPSLPTGYTYNCVTSANLRNTDGTGWIPVNFNRISSNSPISQLPIDPTNTTTSLNYYTYVTGGSWATASSLESQKYLKASAASDSGYNPSRIEMGNNLNLLSQAEGIASWIDFEIGNGSTTINKVSSGINGSWSGSSNHYSSTAKIGNSSGQFSGLAADYVSINDDPSLEIGSAGTIMFWFRPSSLPASQIGLFQKWINTLQSTTIIRITPTAALQVLIADVVTTGGGPNFSTGASVFSANNWYHVALRFNGAGSSNSERAKLYINGALQQVTYGGTIPASFTDGTAPWQIGAATFCDNLTGLMDDVVVYKRALSESEILNIYNAGK